MKTALYGSPGLDAWLDDRLAPGTPLAGSMCGRAFLHLLPERSVRVSPFCETRTDRSLRGTVLLLTLVPPEDTGGGSRPAQLGAELHRRGFAIDWRHALPIFPWPARRRPGIAALDVTYTDGRRDEPALPREPAFVLVEAPHPRLAAILRHLERDVPVVYDAIDVWDGSLGAGWYQAWAEDAMLERADALTASSALLRDELVQRTARDVTLIENGVDPRVFDPNVPRTVPPDLCRGAPTVVYVGSLWGDWVDLDLVDAVARALPAAVFNLIGHPGSRRLPTASNVVALGPRPQRDVPAYLAAADVAIVPFVTNRLSAAVSPLKAFEYLAMARPVVSTPLPEIDGAPGVTIAHDAASFAAAITSAAHAPFPHAESAAFVARHTWQARVERLLETASRGARVALQRKD